MSKREEIRMQFQLSQDKLHNRIREALKDFNDETGIYMKGNFGFYNLLTPGYGDRPELRTVEVSCGSELTINPETYKLTKKVLE